MAGQVQVFNFVSQDAQIALTEFRMEFEMAFMQDTAEQWAKNLGLSFSTKALRARFPIPVSAAGYDEWKGEPKYRSLFQKSIELIPRIWQDGIAELAMVVEAPDFIGWATEPARMAAAASNLPNELVSTLLEAGTSTPCWDGSNFFDTTHPYNVFAPNADYANNFTGGGTTLTTGNVQLARQRFRKIKGPNGKPLGLRMTGVIVPPALEETARNLFEQSYIVQAVGSSFAQVDNIYKGTKYFVSDQLTSDTAWYPVALNKPGYFPWIVLDQVAPETLVLDKKSALYEQTRKVGLQSSFQANAALALPGCIQRYAGV